MQPNLQYQGAFINSNTDQMQMMRGGGVQQNLAYQQPPPQQMYPQPNSAFNNMPPNMNMQQQRQQYYPSFEENKDIYSSRAAINERQSKPAMMVMTPCHPTTPPQSNSKITTPGGQEPTPGNFSLEPRETLDPHTRASLQEKCAIMEYNLKVLMNEVGLTDLTTVENDLRQTQNDLMGSPGDPDLLECLQMLEKIVNIKNQLPLYQKWATLGVTAKEKESPQFKEYLYTLQVSKIDEPSFHPKMMQLFDQGFNDFDRNFQVLLWAEGDVSQAVEFLINDRPAQPNRTPQYQQNYQGSSTSASSHNPHVPHQHPHSDRQIMHSHPVSQSPSSHSVGSMSGYQPQPQIPMDQNVQYQNDNNLFDPHNLAQLRQALQQVNIPSERNDSHKNSQSSSQLPSVESSQLFPSMELQTLEGQLQQKLDNEGLTESSIAQEISDLRDNIRNAKSPALQKRLNDQLRIWLDILQDLVKVTKLRMERLLASIVIDQALEDFDIEAEIEFIQENIQRYRAKGSDSKRVDKLQSELNKCLQAKQYRDNIICYQGLLEGKQVQLPLQQQALQQEQPKQEPETETDDFFSQVEKSQKFDNIGSQAKQPNQPSSSFSEKQPQAPAQKNFNFDEVSQNYPQMDDKQRLAVLNYFFEKDVNQYLQLLILDSHLMQSQVFKDMFEQAEKLKSYNDYEELQKMLFTFFKEGDMNRHCSMKLYLLTEEEAHIIQNRDHSFQIENPLVLQNLIRDLEQIKPPKEVAQILEMIIRNLREGKIERLNNLLLRAKTENGEFGDQIESFLIQLKRFANLIEIKKLLQSFKDLPMRFQELQSSGKLIKVIQSGNDNEIAQALRQIIQEIKSMDKSVQDLDSHLFSLYQKLCQHFPKLQLNLSEDQLLSAFASEQVKGSVLELFKQIHSLKEENNQNQQEVERSFFDSIQQDQDRNKMLLPIMEQIYYEDSNFAKKLIGYLNQTEAGKHFKDAIKGIRTMKDLRTRDLQTIEKCIIYKGTKPQTISDFMQIDVDWEVEGLQQQICEEYHKKGTIPGEKLQCLLYDLIKKRCTFDKFLTQLSQQRQEQPMILTEQTLLNFILLHSDTFLKTLIIMACSSFMPLPLITYLPDFQKLLPKLLKNQPDFQDGLQSKAQLEMVPTEFRPMIYEELFYSFEKFKAVLNFKISANENRAPHCCTSIANLVFHKNFQKHSKTMANYGSVEIQFDYNFEHPMFIPAADAHGLVERELLSKLYPLFNIFVIHIFKSGAELMNEHETVLQEELVKIKNIIQRSLIIVIEHDETIRESYFKPSNEVIKGESSHKQQQVVRIRISPFDRMLDLQKNQLKLFIQNIYFQEIKGFKEYQEQYLNRIQAIENFTGFAQSFSESIVEQDFFEQNNNRAANRKSMGIRSQIKAAKERQRQDQEEQKFMMERIQQLEAAESIENIDSDEEEFENQSQAFYQMKRSYLYDSSSKMRTTPEKLKEAVGIVKEFLKIIDTNRENLHSEQFLTMNFYFKEVCKIDKELVHNRNLNPQKCEQMKKRKDELFENMRKSKPCALTDQLQKIIMHENYIGLSSIISKFLKSYLNGQMKPLISKRSELRAEIQNKQVSKAQSENIIQEIQKLTEQIEKRWYSNEFLFREYYIYERSQNYEVQRVPQQPIAIPAAARKQNQAMAKNVKEFMKDPQEMKDFEIEPIEQQQIGGTYEKYLTLAGLQIHQGQPFEVIDGNNLTFISDVYHKIYNNNTENEQILVVSVIGPQSSGKSLLLNTLFGAQFLSSAGRCTRGIYGCLLDVKGKRCRYSKILLLDSEGIQSTEVRDESFDKRIVFYILCVSHVVLICNKGEMNHPMQEMIKIATDAISQLREQISKQPQVNIIMNMVPQIDEQSLAATIQDLQTAILQMNQQKNIQQLFTIDQKNVFMLPNAFAQSGSEDMVVNQPSYQFAIAVERLRKKILDFLVNNDPNQVANFTLTKWLHFASNFWSFTDSFEGITEFNTLEERKQSQLLHQEIMNIISRHFEKEDKKQKMEETIRNRIESVLQGYQGFGQVAANVLTQKVDQELRSFYKEIEGRIMEQFIEFCDKQNIDTKIKKKRIEQLEQQLRQHILSFQPLINKLIAEFCDQKSKFVADQSLQTSINNLIQNNDKSYKPQEAQKIFESEWLKIEKDLQVQMKNRNQVFEETYKSVQELYRPNIKAVGSFEMEVQLFKEYSELGHKRMLTFLKNSHNFIFFIGRQVRPDPMKYIESINKPREFLMVPEYFSQSRTVEYYNWKKVVEERFNFQTLQFQLYSLFKKKSSLLGPASLISSKTKLDTICFEINEEGLAYGVAMSNDFLKIIQNFDEQILQPGLAKLQYQYQQYYSYDQLTYLAKQVVDQFINTVKNNITFFFRYQAPNNKFLYSKIQGGRQYFEQYGIRNLNNDYVQHGQPFSIFKYTRQSLNLKNELGKEPIQQNEQIVSLMLKQDIQINDRYFQRYLEYLTEPQKHFLNENCQEVETAKQTFFNNIDPETILRKIQQIVLDNIQRVDMKKEGAKSQFVDETVLQIRNAQDTTITEKYCTLDFKLIQRIVMGIQGIVTKIDEELEPYCLKVSEKGIKSLHLIAQSYIISILFEIRWLIEQAPIIQFQKNKDIQKGLFIAKLTSNDKDMDTAIAKRTAGHLAKFINEEQKKSEIDRFQKAISSEKDIFKLKNIVRSIEDSLIGIAEGKDPQLLQQIQRLDALDDQGQKDQPGIFAVVIKRIFNVRGPDNQDHQLQQNMILIGRNDGNHDSSDDSSGQLAVGNEDSDEEESKSSYQRGAVFDQQFNLTLGDAIKFYVHPDLFLQEKFEEQWKNVTEKQLKMSREKFKKNRAEVVKKIVDYFYELIKIAKVKNLKIAGNIFNPVASAEKLMGQAAGPSSENQLKQLQQKALTEYILRICEGSWKRDSQIEIDQVRLEFSPDLSLIYPEDIGFQIEKIYSSVLRQNLKGETISNIVTFIDQFIKSLTDIIDSNDGLTDVELIGNSYQALKQKTMGCDQSCPLCRRQCDQDHGELVGDRIHKCDAGHQIQGFGGNRHRVNDMAITFGCHELEEDDEVFWQGAEIKWKDFKGKIVREKKWYLEEIRSGANRLTKERNVKIWNLIGKQICRFYNKQERIPITFMKADMNQKKAGMAVGKCLYIFLLDKSGSMTDQENNGQTKWQNLRQAVAGFIGVLSSNQVMRSCSYISFVTYNGAATLDCDQQQPSQQLISLLPASPNGGTNFEPPLNLAKLQMEQNYNKYQIFVVVMMSDGESSYPGNAINAIRSSPQLMQKLQFKSIAYGKDAKIDGILKPMANDLNGTFTNVLEPAQLQQQLVSVIPNIYNGQGQN